MSLRGLPQKAVAISVVGGVMRSPRFARDDSVFFDWLRPFDKLRMSGLTFFEIHKNSLNCYF
jgi:hypothetical protein